MTPLRAAALSTGIHARAVWIGQKGGRQRRRCAREFTGSHHCQQCLWQGHCWQSRMSDRNFAKNFAKLFSSGLCCLFIGLGGPENINQMKSGGNQDESVKFWGEQASIHWIITDPRREVRLLGYGCARRGAREKERGRGRAFRHAGWRSESRSRVEGKPAFAFMRPTHELSALLRAREA